MFESDFESTDEEAQEGDAGEQDVQNEEQQARKVCLRPILELERHIWLIGIDLGSLRVQGLKGPLLLPTLVKK